MTAIDDAMKQAFLDSYRLYELEREYNYQNWGKYPYRDRKNSVQIIADFNANAYSVNGVFVTEESYTLVYPPTVIESVQQVLVGTQEVYGNLYASAISYTEGDDGGQVITIEYAKQLIASYEVYETVTTVEYVENEDVEVQTMKYIFPFDCVPDELGRLRLSF